VPLTDDELESLIPTIHQSPRSDTVRAVGRGLIRRRRFAEAADLLTASLRTLDDPQIWSLLAHACLGATRHQQALTALHQVDCGPATSPENARLLVLTLERLRRRDEARRLAHALLELHPRDRVCRDVLDRLQGRLQGRPQPAVRAASDPFYTVERAEQYVQLGRIDRAIRIYRRIQLVHPHDASLAARVGELLALDRSATPDLAETLPPPGLTAIRPLHPPPTLLADEAVDDSEDAPTVNLDGSEGLDTQLHPWRPVRGDA